MPSLIATTGALRLAAVALPMIILIALGGLLALIAMIMPADRRKFILQLAPYAGAAIAALAGNKHND